MRFILLFIFVVGLNTAKSQSTVTASADIQTLMDKFVEQNANDEFEGIRIMLSLTRDRRKIDASKARFESTFPAYDCKMVFQDPYYKLVAGAFRNKLDASVVLDAFREVFPGATEIIDDVRHEEIFETMMAAEE